MRIALDAQPLIGERLTGIGYCQAGQLTALAKQYPNDSYCLQYFSGRDDAPKRERLQPYLRENVTLQAAKASGYLYRMALTILPVSYQHYFGKDAEITHFFNYIVPPNVHGKTVVTVHDMVYKAYPETMRGRTKYMLQLGLKKSLECADRIVTDSEFSKSEICRYFPQYQEKLRVVYCGVNTKQFHSACESEIQEARKKYDLDRDYFLYLGTVEPRKNLSRLIEAYQIFVRGKQSPPYLVLAGGNGWRNSEIYQKASELGIQKYVKFTEYVPEEFLCPLMCGALAFVFPSIYEGFGMPPLEAMACGVPVLTAVAASLPEVVGEDAVLVDPYKPDEIAGGLERLYMDEKLRKRLSEAGKRRVLDYSWERSAEQLHAIYEELCHG